LCIPFFVEQISTDTNVYVQEYFKALMDENPLLSFPDSASECDFFADVIHSPCKTHNFVVAVFVGRTSLMFRGMGSAMGGLGQIRTASRWYPHAKQALAKDGSSQKDKST
jgi:hypothetical protein